MSINIRKFKKEGKDAPSLERVKESDEDWEKISKHIRKRAEELAEKLKGEPFVKKLLKETICNYIDDSDMHNAGESAYNIVCENDDIWNTIKEVQEMKKEHEKRFKIKK